MSDRVLVAYGTRTGTTASVAEFMGEILAAEGLQVDVRKVREAEGASGYDAVVLGSAIRAGKLMPEIVEFVKANQAGLKAMPFAAFLVCATLQEDTEENREEVAGYLTPMRELVEPDVEGYFAGAIDMNKLSWPLRLLLRIMKAEGGDWRDWGAIRVWAGRLPEALGLDTSG